MRCDDAGVYKKNETDQFQSLLGFLMRCDNNKTMKAEYVRMMFQSLLGFLMRCDRTYRLPHGYRGRVSIPAGFSDALRL